MKKTNALEHWREFEKFVLDFLKDRYNITEEKFAMLTPPSGDGGYDGILYSEVNLSNNNIREILFEAKLRSAIGTSLPLNDFSKALIIAVNRFTDEVYIASNLVFSPDTLYQLDVYAKRMGMYIETLNGKVLYEWYNKQCSDVKRKYSSDFIAFLEKSSEAIKLGEFNNYHQKESNTVCNIEYVKDLDRNKQINEIEQNISLHSGGLVLFYGEQGCGKSCMCTEIKHHIEKRKYKTFELNMSEQDTSRTVFLKFLECVWGFSPEIIIQSPASEIKELFCKIGAVTLSSSDIECLQFIFSKDIKDYTGNSDVYQYMLLNIIERLFFHYSNRIPYCIHIHNLESAYEESCAFIQKIIDKLSVCKIIFLVEARSNYAGEMKISQKDWISIINRFRNLNSFIGEYEIKKFSMIESEEYIKNVYPALKYTQVKKLAQSLPDNPLILDASLCVLKPKLDSGCFSEIEFESEIRYFNCNYDLSILTEMLRNIISRSKNEQLLTQSFAMLSLLNGTCFVDNIVKITGENQKEIKTILYDTGLINLDNDVICVKHELYVKTLQKHSVYISGVLLEDLANKMIENIELFYKDVLGRSVLHIKLLNIIQDYASMLSLCVKTGKALYQQGDTKQALEIYKVAYNAFESKCVDSIRFTLLKLEILENMISIKWNMVGGTDHELDTLLSKFHLMISTSRRFFKHHIKYIEACIYEILFEMKQMHVESEHKKCADNAYKAKRIAQKYNGYQNFPHVLEQVLWLKSLSIKHLSGMESCLTSFKHDTSKYPETPLLHYSYYTHKAAYIAGEKPKSALNYFKLNNRYYDQLSMSDQLHNKVNIANMFFYLHEYDRAEELSEEVIKDALLYDVNLELGRAYNTIGNCCCVKNKIEHSINYFEKSISRFKYINHSIHLWPPLVNCAFVYVKQDNYVEAFALLKNAVPIFLKRSNELTHSSGKDIAHMNKLIIGVIITLHLLWRISVGIKDAKILYKQLFDETVDYMPEQIDEICSDNERFEKYFFNTIYEHCGNILLKL